MIWNRSVPVNTQLPHVFYKDVAAAVTWLSKTFGFREHFRYGAPDEVGGAQIHLGDAWIMLHQARSGSASPAELGFGTQSATVFVEDVDVHCERTKAAGAKIVEELHETEYGERQYGVEDYEGHKWLFARHARNVDPSEWGAMVVEAITPPEQISLAPMLSVRHGAQAVEFYKAAFGADVLSCFDGDKDDVVAELSIGTYRFWVTSESPQNLNFSPESLGGGTVRMVLVAADPDAVFARAVGAGAKIVWPVEDQHYGWRVGRIVDPFGHHWEIGKPLAKS